MLFSRLFRAAYQRRLLKKKPAFRFLAEREPDNEIICLDTETSSLDPGSASIISIGAVMIRNNRIINRERINLHIRPDKTLNDESIKIHRLRNQDLTDAHSLTSALEQWLAFVGSRPILGYHIRFDLALLNRLLMQQYSIKLPNRTIELSDIYYRKINRLHPQGLHDLRFDSMAATLNIDPMGRHTAIGDALTTALMYIRLMKGPVPRPSRKRKTTHF